MRPELSEPFVARIVQSSDGRWRAQSLLDHLVNTGEQAAVFAQSFGARAGCDLPAACTLQDLHAARSEQVRANVARLRPTNRRFPEGRASAVSSLDPTDHRGRDWTVVPRMGG